MAVQAHVVEALAAGREVKRNQGRPLWGALERPVPTNDGLLAVSADGEAPFARLCRLCGVDPGAVSRPTAEERVAERLATAPAQKWEEALVEEGIGCWALPEHLDLAGLPDDPRLTGLFEPLAGTSRAPTSPWRFAS
jgi:hypothetical protein